MSNLVAGIPFAVLITGAVLVGLYLANELYDSGIQHWRSRKIGHLAGAAGYLLCVLLFNSWYWTIIISVGFVVLLGGARLLAPHTFRGVGGTGRPGVWAEIWYPLSGTICFVVGWAIFNRPFETFACVAMMGAGDAVTGLVRAKFCTKPEKHWSGSIAMFATCLLLAWCFIHPFWIGVITALAATATEWACGDVSKVKWLRKVDDNLSIPLVSLAVLLGILYAIDLL